MRLRYLAKLQDGSQKFFDKRLGAMSWARREMARWCKVYLLEGQCPLVAHYAPDPKMPSRYIPQPVVGIVDLLHPEREPFHNLVNRRAAIIEIRRPAPDMLTLGELAEMHKVRPGHIKRLTDSCRLVFIKVRGIRFYQKDQPVPPMPYIRRRKEIVWAMNYDECIQCGTQSRPHAGKGLCQSCREKNIRLAKKQATG